MRGRPRQGKAWQGVAKGVVLYHVPVFSHLRDAGISIESGAVDPEYLREEPCFLIVVVASCCCIGCLSIFTLFSIMIPMSHRTALYCIVSYHFALYKSIDLFIN